jgi:hypothetical protein
MSFYHRATVSLANKDNAKIINERRRQAQAWIRRSKESKKSSKTIQMKERSDG